MNFACPMNHVASAMMMSRIVYSTTITQCCFSQFRMFHS